MRTLGLQIVRGDYAPGDTIDTEVVAKELDVSKTVLREALRVLGAKGLVDSRPKRGTFVRERAAWNLLDTDVMLWRREARRKDDRLLSELSELRDLIEPESARLAAIHRTDRDLARLAQSIEAMRAVEPNSDDVVEVDLDFHLKLLHASHNELLIRLDSVLIHAVGARDRISRNVLRRPFSGPGPEHEDVFEAVRRQDPEGAANAMRYLLRESSHDMFMGEPPIPDGAMVPTDHPIDDPA